jgi:hypothetical protein
MAEDRITAPRQPWQRPKRTVAAAIAALVEAFADEVLKRSH